MSKLPGYTMVETLHEGPTTVVVRGRREADGVVVALKVLRREATEPEAQRLRREHALLAGLAVPGLPRALGLETLDGQLALVMESLPGRPLDDVLRAGRLALGPALQLAVALAGVIGQLHLAGVIHKDIKPQNILVDLAAGEVGIVDLGVAALRSQETPAREGTFEGTLAYLSPEQTGRMNRRVDHRADLYAFGVTLYEIVTGVLPFTSADPLELVHSHVARAPAAPHTVDPDVPRVVSDIILKLLAKAAEDRYQSAFGLQADLAECGERLRTTGRVDPFELGLRDRGYDLRLAQRLYGREDAHRNLLAGHARARAGAAEMLLLSGPSGVGKSALVDAVRTELAHDGAFITGKCDQLDRGTPYAPLERAFQELVRRVLTEPPAALEAVRARLLAALGSSGRVVADLVPEIELVIGPQRPVPELAPAESRNRLNLVFQRFLGAFTAPGRPLTLFLDDLQWADPATLKLLAALLTDPDGGHLLVIGACRDSEVDDEHPLARMLADLHAAGRPVSVIPLAPLAVAEVAAFIADALACEVDEVSPLAALLRDKTGGNPFFLGQMLLGLFHDGLLAFDAGRGAWSWDLDAVRMATGDDVLALVTGKLQALAPATQRVLQFAACLGHRFDTETLAGALEQPAPEVERALAEAVRAGLLVEEVDGPGRVHRFTHDRIQQAAHAQIDEAQRAAVHLRFGRLLRARLGPEPRDDELFAAVHHLNLGAALVTDRDERDALTRINVTAGRRARVAAAFDAAAGYLTAALAGLDPDSWARDHARTFSIHAEQAECTYLCGRFAEAEAACRGLLARVRSPEQALLLEGRRMEMRIARSRFAEAVDIGIAVLAPMGIHMPATEEERVAALGDRLAEVEAILGDRRIDTLLDAPRLSDPAIEAQANLLMILCMAGYYVSVTVYTQAATEQIILSLKHGNSPLSPIAYMAYAFVLAGLLGNYQRAEAFAELSLALHARTPDPRVECKIYQMAGTILHFRQPMRVALAHLERSYRAGREHGDFVFLSAAADNSFPYKFAIGSLPAMRDSVAEMLAMVHRAQDALSIAYLSIASQLVAALEGRTDGPRTLTGGGFVEDGFAAGLVRDGLLPIACWCHVARLMLCYLHGDMAGASAAAEAAEPLAMAAGGQYFPTEITFFGCLAAAAAVPEDVEAARRRDERLARGGETLAVWAANSPDNYRHKQALVEAEVARLAGRHDDATDGFERALAAARAEGFLRDEAIVAERAALFHHARGRPTIARAYMAEAHAAYLRWGATVKATALAESYADLLPHLAALATGGEGSWTPTTRVGSNELVDAATLVRAAQTLVGEVVLEVVLERLMRLVVESAGAQRGVLLLAPDGPLQVAARLDDDRVEVGEPLPLEQATDIAGSVVRYVARTREAVVLDDATRDHRFATDPYLAGQRPRSILCLALTQNDRLTGVVYLEHNTASGAFTRARVDLAGLLASLAATAVANAQLYARVDEVTRALRGANESLEAEVSRRTEDLRATNDRLEVELAERARAEHARADLHGQVVRMQEQRLAELSTPILPIADRVVVMPLIGTMDAQRGRQVLEAALMGVHEHRAEVVILDVTGMKLVDVEVADMLANTAGALELLGARALVTGLSPEIAWTFVERGESLGKMKTVATLKAAVAQAGSLARRKPTTR